MFQENGDMVSIVPYNWTNEFAGRRLPLFCRDCPRSPFAKPLARQIVVVDRVVEPMVIKMLTGGQEK